MIVLFVCVAVLLAVIFGAIKLVQTSKNKQAAHWAAVEGRVVSAQVFRNNDLDGQPQDEPLITYEYVVAKQTFRSTRVKFGFTPKTKPTMAKYPSGSIVQVFYDPSKPAESVLER
jgi:hypothetical protein